MLRRMTKTVHVRDIVIGGMAPISIQSMTNTDTANVSETVSQILALEEAGCEIVRVSVYNEDCAQAIREIKAKTHVPLVADIHFDHRLALLAIENGIDKLRINPGNIGSKIKVNELVHAAKANQIPIRIGVNAGSLQKDILGKYGMTSSQGMVESALEHIAILEELYFEDIVVSLKASNVQKTVDACKLLAEKVPYPLHIGVTEAGMGEMAMLKAATGIGALLLDGIGDTIRVSMTGDPVQEVVAAEKILSAIGIRKNGIEIISCPTCGRTGFDMSEIVQEVQNRLPKTKHYLQVAIMGCAVNGPGEAAEADLGVAFGKDNCVLFCKGEKIKTIPREDAVEALLDQISIQLASAN